MSLGRLALRKRRIARCGAEPKDRLGSYPLRAAWTASLWAGSPVAELLAAPWRRRLGR
jgi:hypothetical protein